jgi:hypothetical protein
MADGTLPIKRMSNTTAEWLDWQGQPLFWPLTEFAKSLEMLQCHEAKRPEFGGEPTMPLRRLCHEVMPRLK